MRRLTFFLLLFLYPFVSVYSQEEFFGKQNGMSLSYLEGLNTKNYPVNAVGLSTYFKSGVAIAVGLENANYKSYPIAAILFCPDFENNPNHIRACTGVSYSYLESLNIVGINLGLFKCFLPESNYPFSINGSFSAQTAFGKNNETGLETIWAIGYGYTQAFFAKGKIYPFIGILNSYSIEDESNLFSAFIGLNIKLGSKSKKNLPQSSVGK